ncbi:MAG: nitrogenase cofactor biosynthesis protein NifB [Magnetococcus sp. YQC-3]
MSTVYHLGVGSAGSGNALVEEHPCYSEGASHRYARLHLAVAPACNMQCRYCNRKFDCSNESRPGVVSALLSPAQAVQRTREAMQRLPNLRVVGFAGPGDPLANRERLFATCRQLGRAFPGLHLCLSTNGLSLPESVREIVDSGIRHVTVTLNTLDPEVGAAIYSWIYWHRRRRRGLEAARILLEQQLAGIAALLANGLLVKINTVLIPGVNSEQVAEINRLVGTMGVFSHNVMPLISAAEHGTYYGVMGVAGPSAESLQQVRDQCQGAARLMTHCRQCRADAAGLLAMDRHAEWTNAPADGKRVIAIHRPRSPLPARPVRLAVASRTGDTVDTHFGHAEFFRIYQVTGEQIEYQGTCVVSRYCQGDDHCVDEDNALDTVLKLLNDCQGVICSRIGYTPWQALLARGILPDNNHADWSVEDALRQVALGLQEAALPDNRLASVC